MVMKRTKVPDKHQVKANLNKAIGRTIEEQLVARVTASASKKLSVSIIMIISPMNQWIDYRCSCIMLCNLSTAPWSSDPGGR